MDYINASLPLQLLLVLAASFLIGLAMEGRKVGGKRHSPGGVRTFPLICLAGFLLGLLDRDHPSETIGRFVVGLAILGVWMSLLYRSKIATGSYGMTTEAFAIVTYIIGGLAALQLWWMVAALTVLMLALQELKGPLERVVHWLPEDELITIAKFVLLAVVILPLMPDRPYTRFALNPRTIWWIVVAVAGISYVSYILQRVTRRVRHSLLLTGLLGGAYSSTVTAVVLARRQGQASGRASLAVAGSILVASGVMNLRILVLVGLFNVELMRALAWPLALAAAIGMAAGMALLAGRRTDVRGDNEALVGKTSSPLELKAALAFTVVFVIIMVLTQEASRLLGQQGLYALAGLTGLGVVDPFVLTMTQSAGDAYNGAAAPIGQVSIGAAALAVVIAAAVNNVAKGVYALSFANRRTGLTTLLLLIGLAIATLLAWAAMVQAKWTRSPW